MKGYGDLNNITSYQLLGSKRARIIFLKKYVWVSGAFSAGENAPCHIEMKIFHTCQLVPKSEFYHAGLENFEVHKDHSFIFKKLIIVKSTYIIILKPFSDFFFCFLNSFLLFFSRGFHSFKCRFSNFIYTFTSRV